MAFSLRTAFTLAAVPALCLMAAGCGGSGDPLAGLSAKQVLTKAVDNLKSAPSFHLAGTVRQNGRISMDLTYKRGTGCEGTLGLSQGSIYLLAIGSTAWFKPNRAYWDSVTGGSAAASSVQAIVGGKYLKTSTTASSGAAGLAQLCDANSLASSFTSPKDIVKGATSTINGQQALALKDPAKSSVMYVTDSSSPQILRVVGNQSNSGGLVNFTGYGKSVTLKAPPASQTIDGAQYGF